MIDTVNSPIFYHIGSLCMKYWYRPKSHWAVTYLAEGGGIWRSNMKGRGRFVRREDCRGGGEKNRRAQSNCSFKIAQETPKKQRIFLYPLKSLLGAQDWPRAEMNTPELWGSWGITYFGFSKVEVDSLDLFQEHQQNIIAYWGLSHFVLCFVVSLKNGTLTQSSYYFCGTNKPWNTLMFHGSILRDFKPKKTTVWFAFNFLNGMQR